MCSTKLISVNVIRNLQNNEINFIVLEIIYAGRKVKKVKYYFEV